MVIGLTNEDGQETRTEVRIWHHISRWWTGASAIKGRPAGTERRVAAGHRVGI